MIEIIDGKFGLPYLDSYQWLQTDESPGELFPILEQLFSQMLGWC